MEMINLQIIIDYAIKFFMFSIDKMEGIAGFMSFFIAIRVYRKQLQDKIEDSRDKRIEINLLLGKEWDDLWTRITAFPEKNKDLFRKELHDIEDENIRLAISNATSLLARVHLYFEQTNQDIEKNAYWINIFRHVFNKRVFCSDFDKHRNRYSTEFQNHVEKIRNIADTKELKHLQKNVETEISDEVSVTILSNKNPDEE